MAGTLVLFFHSEPEKSRTNRAMADAAAHVDGVTVVDMGALYPDIRTLDSDAEVARLFTAERLVLQFPIHWYCAPPLLLAWQNTVLTRMFYMKPEEEGERISGLPFMLAVTAGNTPEAYSAEGINLFPLPELLKPFHSTASRCALDWYEPFVTYRANRLSDEQRAELGQRYAAHLAGWTASIPRKQEAQP